MDMIEDKVKIDEFENSFKKIFKNNNPFGEVFQYKIQEGLILCPTEGYFLTKRQFTALLVTLDEIGDKEVIISIVEYDDNYFKDSEHWLINSKIEFNDYINMPIYLENAIYSKNGEWGILISHEEHAVIGGTSEFLNKFKNNYLEWRKDIDNFNQMWEKNKMIYDSDITWIDNLKTHLKIDYSR
ncbi:hypothetical protein [Clostridium botulinum]|uniref:hypothetical protein n=1 Tax=Clostridium botulinum TaxID=1491 RepID=UPI003DA62CFF